MDVEKMLKEQEKLDKACLKKAGLTAYPFDMVKTAYRVELGELMQEWKQFKFWKINKGDINKEKMLEEWADCFHFALSLENFQGRISDGMCEAKLILNSMSGKTGEKIYKILDCCFEGSMWRLESTISLGLELGYTLEELEKAYWEKNKINWKRIKEGY